MNNNTGVSREYSWTISVSWDNSCMYQLVSEDTMQCIHVTYHIVYLKSSSSWFDCGVTHQIWHTISSFKIRGCVAVPKCVWHVFPKSSSYDCRSEMRQRQRIIIMFVQDAPSLLASWKVDFSFSFFITSVEVTIRELVDVQVCDQVSHNLQCYDISNLAFNLRGWVLKHDHPYKVPSVLCY